MNVSLHIFLLLLLACGCSTLVKRHVQYHLPEKPQSTVFTFKDVSGDFSYSREVAWRRPRLATRYQMTAPAKKGKLLEKTFALSALGSVKGRNGKRQLAYRPLLSQHTVWLEGKKFFSQIKLIPKKRRIQVLMQSPEPKWNGVKEIRVPKGNVICFYSQLPECLIAAGLLERVRDGGAAKLSFVIIWDSYPYHQEHYTGLQSSPFAPASLSVEDPNRGGGRYSVEVAGQIINLHFSKNGEFARLFWTSQGISLVPPKEAIDMDGF